MDAVLFLPATCCRNEEPRGETFHLAVRFGSRANCTVSFPEFYFCLGSIILQADGSASPSLAQSLLEAVQEGQKVAGEILDHEDVKHICGALYGGT